MTNTQFIYLTSWSDTLIWHPDLTPRSDIPIWHPDLTYWIRMGSGCWISITDPTSWSHIPSRYPDSALWSDTLIWHLIRHLDVKTFQIPCLIFRLDNKTWSDWLSAVTRWPIELFLPAEKVPKFPSTLTPPWMKSHPRFFWSVHYRAVI